MTPAVGLSVLTAEVLAIAALAGHRRGARIGVALSVLLLPLPAFVGGPTAFARFWLAAAALWCFLRGMDLASDQPARPFGARLLHLLAVIDTRLVTPAPRTADLRTARQFVVGAAVAAAAFGVVKAGDALSAWPRFTLRWLAGALMIVAAFMTASVEATRPGTTSTGQPSLERPSTPRVSPPCEKKVSTARPPQRTGKPPRRSSSIE
jgi:hypothetical protein